MRPGPRAVNEQRACGKQHKDLSDRRPTRSSVQSSDQRTARRPYPYAVHDHADAKYVGMRMWVTDEGKIGLANSEVDVVRQFEARHCGRRCAGGSPIANAIEQGG